VVKKRMLTGMLAGLSVAALAAGPVMAQDAEAAGEGEVVEVVGVEYAYQGMPTSVPVGTSLALRNEGIEFHELAVARVGDDVTESTEELLAMGEAAITSGKVELIGDPPPGAVPGETSELMTSLEREGRYVIVCFIPQGFIPEVLAELGVTEGMAQEDWPPEAKAILSNPPHVVAGMFQDFTVTAPGTEPGPLPEMEATEDAAEDTADDAEEQADAKEDELEDKADELEEEVRDDD
jgi:hypothetical protein